MTAQMPDGIFIERRLCDVCGLHDITPFMPESLGLTPAAPHTACWRGHINRYRPARHLARQPRPGYPSAAGGAVWAGDQRLHLELPFTGGILAGRDFHREFYVLRGFAPAWKYQTVYEASFEQGPCGNSGM